MAFGTLGTNGIGGWYVLTKSQEWFWVVIFLVLVIPTSSIKELHLLLMILFPHRGC